MLNNLAGKGSTALRVQNKVTVLNVIKEHNLSTRAEIAAITHITKATISEIVAELIQEDFVVESSLINEETRMGRKGTPLKFNHDCAYTLSIDLGGTKIKLALFNAGLELMDEKVISTFKTKTRHDFMAHFNQAILSFIAGLKVDRNKIAAIGIATAGIVNHETGFILEGSPNLPEWEGFNLVDEVHTATDIPVVIENDVRAALIGEICAGSCKNVSSAMLIGIGTGLGSALVIDGKLMRGNRNAAGEIGYMILSREQLNNNWHNKGALETYCSGSGIEQRYASITGNALSCSEIFARIESDHLAQALIEELSDSLAIGVINSITIANPEKIILYGGVCTNSQHFLERTQAIINRHTLTNTSVQLELSEMGSNAPIFGMAVMAMSCAHPTINFLKNIQLK